MTNPMTPTEQDKELRERVEKQFDDFIVDLRVNTPDGWEVKKYIDLDEALQLITADRKRVALEARIDELKSLPVNWEHCYDNTLRKHYSKVYNDVYNKRLAELKAQQEKL